MQNVINRKKSQHTFRNDEKEIFIAIVEGANVPHNVAIQPAFIIRTYGLFDIMKTEATHSQLFVHK